MKFQKLKISDVVLITPKVFGDERGFFLESYSTQKFQEAGINTVFVQDNHSKSVKNVLRGLHYQTAPKTQAKLIRVTQGEVFDVVVDIRKNSPTFGQWLSVTLSAKNKQILYIPEGFAHGFAVTSEIAEFEYKCSNFYSPKHEAGVAWDDPNLNINWPIKNPILSEKDKKNPRLKMISF